ncbi:MULTISPECIES: putative bifunctional diguanylate cyclase/phosphodiesterase [Sphingomonas]|uniref:GGDEF domain-containing response regulator n=1 Tax=Sphingomonas adhaesiva TaxID=28212 RepID=A0A2A4I7N1_9SPHN|nr:MULTISPECIES: EAL domain-containing protein [Sphingomonas]PCG14987.1 GGDEF domain-containing response regulator [Sphingomonas adhaesiva]PZU81314.1 MAG: GGDEF domain-containing protein [Sphingomonas sp.]
MRILIVDDEPLVHESYRLSFAPPAAAQGALSAMAADLFADAAARDAEAAPPAFDVTYHVQGLDAVAAVEQAIAAGAPFQVAFIDVRMPPGIDGRETARRIRALDPEINLVIVTGYSDFSPVEISRVAGPADKIFYIAKPFEVAEVVQTATALVQRWENDRALAATRAALAHHVLMLEQQTIELAAKESRALHIASHDTLTGAPNRFAFQRALADRVRVGGAGFAVAMMDLDRFKSVNDTLGHMAGDALLRAICAILNDGIPTGGTVARLGGDEFGLLFEAEDQAAALGVAQRLVAACATPQTIYGHCVEGAASIGLVMADGRGDPGDLLRRADLALYEAKRQGRGRACAFDARLDEDVRLRRRIETGLSQAIARDELSMVYQPIVTGARHEIVGFEALLRWQTEDHGPISPAVFVPIAEESNLIHELGDWVLDRSLAALATWPGQYVSINFSPRQFRRPHFVDDIAQKVAAAGIAPERVQIEITETAIFDDADRAAETLNRLRALGFRIALDDFGTGYSSLYNIRTFALDVLKIDRSFIDGMPRERESMAIVRSIIHLAQSLGLGVIAEGVETRAQVDLLRAAGASHLQGYHFSRPVAPAAALDLAHRRWLSPVRAVATGTHG